MTQTSKNVTVNQGKHHNNKFEILTTVDKFLEKYKLPQPTKKK